MVKNAVGSALAAVAWRGSSTARQRACCRLTAAISSDSPLNDTRACNSCRPPPRQQPPAAPRACIDAQTRQAHSLGSSVDLRSACGPDITGGGDSAGCLRPGPSGYYTFQKWAAKIQAKQAKEKICRKLSTRLKYQNMCQKRNVRRERCVFSPLYYEFFGQKTEGPRRSTSRNYSPAPSHPARTPLHHDATAARAQSLRPLRHAYPVLLSFAPSCAAGRQCAGIQAPPRGGHSHTQGRD